MRGLRRATLLLALACASCAIDLRGLAPERPDGGPECVPQAELCNGIDDDCDLAIDEGFDLQSDPRNCGRCDRACPEEPANGAPECDRGECGVACDPGWADCNASPSDGCEAMRSSPATCGACDRSCGAAAPFCELDPALGYRCVDTCGTGATECGESCVDTATDAAHCGGCGAACEGGAHATPVCGGGTCGLRCDAGFGDCDADPTNGCETPLDTVEACGACGATCAFDRAAASCATGTCALGACEPLYGDCDGVARNGCELGLGTLANCGACARPCVIANGSGACDTGVCLLRSCASGYDDCNADPADGCEARLSSDRAHCGSCNVPCPGTCTAGACDELCNGRDDDGDGTIDEGGVCPCPIEHRGGHAYLFCTAARRSWTGARDECSRLGYDLVTIDDGTENAWVEGAMDRHDGSRSFWIGLNDRDAEGTWRWVSGASSSYRRWASGEPNDWFGEDCVTMAGGTGDRWNDADCDDSNPYACESR